jgi:hypothetical protein
MFKVLLQTTIESADDDWSIARFSRLSSLLDDQRDVKGRKLFDITARDRESVEAPDPILSTLDTSDFDELWLFAVDVGNGLAPEDCEAISRFRRNGGGLLVTRDHMDLGSSVCALGGVGSAHYFHSRNVDPNVENQVIDDSYSADISWPNYHSGANGDFQEVEVVGEIHPVLENPEASGGAIRFLPSHPHEGAVGAPPNESARVITRGISKVTGKDFNIAVAFEPGESGGAAVAQSTFHHFADYNWDPRLGCPSFVREPPGQGLLRSPVAMADTHRYMTNLASWLVRRR